MSRRLATAVLATALGIVPAVPALATPTPSPSPTTTTRTTTTPDAAPAPKASRPKLRMGSQGRAVATLQKRLGALGYWTGRPTGRYDHTTAQAVMALQKVAGIGRDGVTGPATWRALDRGALPQVRSTRGRVVEVDLATQVMVFVVDGRIRWIVNTSTGAAATPTPRGRYRIYRQQDGWRVAPLGKLYRPKYFHGGYAIHGVKDGHIPGYAASHGCTRVSMAAMDMMWAKGGLRNADRVWIY